MLTLNKDWINWIIECTQQGCTTDDMANSMVQAGFSRDLAYYHLVYFQQNFNKSSICDSHDSNSKPFNFYEYKEFNPTSKNYFTFDNKKYPIALKIQKPDIMVINNFLSDDECNTIIELSKPTMERSYVVDEAKDIDADKQKTVHEARTSTGTHLNDNINPIIADISVKIAAFFAHSTDKMEALQILNYAPGAQYKPHFDYFPPNTKGGQDIIQRTGQRKATCIIYLSEVESGGATIFPDAWGRFISVYPQKGSLLYFRYHNEQNQLDSSTLHGGSPIIEGSKWIATKWVH